MTEGLRFCRCARSGRCDVCKNRKAELRGRLDGLREAVAVLKHFYPEVTFPEVEDYVARVHVAAKAPPPVPFTALDLPLPGNQP